jgi:hypothetical protein
LGGGAVVLGGVLATDLFAAVGGGTGASSGSFHGVCGVPPFL